MRGVSYTRWRMNLSGRKRLGRPRTFMRQSFFYFSHFASVAQRHCSNQAEFRTLVYEALAVLARSGKLGNQVEFMLHCAFRGEGQLLYCTELVYVFTISCITGTDMSSASQCACAYEPSGQKLF